MINSQPPDWGTDPLSDAVDRAHNRALQNWTQFKSLRETIVEIDSLFQIIAENLNETQDWMIGFFLIRAHSAFRACVTLALSGQIPESYAVQRVCIENGLYGIYLKFHEASFETWLNRNDTDESLQKVKDEFKIGDLFRFLDEKDKPNAMIARSLYDWTIDFGAHPNQLSITTNMKMTKIESRILWNIAYISDDPVPTEMCLKRAKETGVNSLKIFQNVFKARFDLLGISSRLDQLFRNL